MLRHMCTFFAYHTITLTTSKKGATAAADNLTMAPVEEPKEDNILSFSKIDFLKQCPMRHGNVRCKNKSKCNLNTCPEDNGVQQANELRDQLVQLAAKTKDQRHEDTPAHGPTSNIKSGFSWSGLCAKSM